MIKRISALAFLLMLILNTDIFAQTAVGVYVSPDINRTVNPFDTGKPGNDLGVTLGLSVQNKLTERLSLLSGIQYSLKKITYKGLISSMTVDQEGTVPDMSFYQSRQHFIEVPLQLRYELTSKGTRLIPYVQAGVVGTWVTSIKNEYANESGDRIETKPKIVASRFNPVPEVGVGVAYRISEHLGFNVQPTIRMEFDNPMYRSPVSISRLGLGTTLFFKF